MTKMFAIAAVAEDRTIGDGGTIPWDYSEDTDLFQHMVEDTIMVVGKNTYENIRPYFGNEMWVLSNTLSSHRKLRPDNSFYDRFFNNGDFLIEEIKRTTTDKLISVCGGSSVYNLLTPYCDEIVLTLVPGEYQGDTKFPRLSEDVWDETASFILDKENGLKVTHYSRNSKEPTDFYTER